MTAAALLLHFCGPHAVHLAPHVTHAAHAWHVPVATLTSLVFVESTCAPDADDGRGDVGLGQIRVGTLAARGHTAEELRDPALNLYLAARHLAHWRHRCGDLRAALGVFAGYRTCAAGRASGYSARVLRLAAWQPGPRRS